LQVVGDLALTVQNRIFDGLRVTVPQVFEELLHLDQRPEPHPIRPMIGRALQDDPPERPALGFRVLPHHQPARAVAHEINLGLGMTGNGKFVM
jgi:hypothetical protein